ncbi:DUF3916 domain-containing protein [Asticcacaulis sp. YBE204]|uniref:DUF3916 domain-containing protein n=1 Tax=Asticcacaulis sp. YBE204 TaxID=1282363 RepID=UPI0003C3FE5B|nr:DUF3916 domain-containing protein [Asticcacaulis sp. YBE204]ESQ79585.1 hypothetical protein AEYBE204_07015 [Asticcacaulis sp. YBE204]
MAKRYMEIFAGNLSRYRRGRTKTMLRDLKLWSDTLADKWPDTHPRGAGFDSWKTPVAGSLVNLPNSSRHTQRRYIELVLRAAVNMRNHKPDAAQGARVTAILTLPKLFDSGVHIFFNESYWQRFAERHNSDDLWIPLLPSRGLLKSYGLRVPEGFEARGYRTYWRDDTIDPPYEKTREVWIYSEVL